ncbi:PIG-L family deacetylase [Mucilaginibacter sp. JRF]|uniref:PIG-L deacetylase family protein n=1 Tax=Mucilaginibacter sp. JRF TaxID=2780088 RepID=UPI00187E2249|nr:PIG-L family deacetylase [Mucilaginibacter sp. JRF]MBE9584298.1 PIG-L family deacetylase [Mucilaginibacter sp. JRF]
MVVTGKNILAIVAHPDDETIGCGGFLHKASINNANCRVLLPLKRGDERGVTHWTDLVSQLTDACDILGAKLVMPADMVDDLTAELNVQAINQIIHSHVQWADIIVTHWHGDSHQAHRALYRAVEIATRPFRVHKTVMFFEVATSTDQAFIYNFSPNFFVGLSTENVAKKKTAMDKYNTENELGRTPENLEYLMRLRGSQTGMEFAEAFMIARHFWE